MQTDQRQPGMDICIHCRDADLAEFKSRLSFEAAIARLRLGQGDYANMRLDTYRPQNQSQAAALHTAESLVRGLAGNCRGLWLWSEGYGLGKTHLLVAVLFEAAKCGHSIALYDEPGLLNEIRETYNSNGQSARDIIMQARGAQVFGLDDLGRGYVRTESLNWYQNEVMYPILDERYNVNRPTIVTSNLNPTELERRLGGAAYSRLRGLCPAVVQVTGEDYRQRRPR